jgi:hypothetical protein
MAKCTGKTQAGKRCKRVAMKGRKRCGVHTTGKKAAKKPAKRRKSVRKSSKKKMSKAARTNKMYKGLEDKLNKSGGVDKKIFKRGTSARIKPIIKKAWLKNKKIKLKAAVRAKFKAAVKRAGY